MNSSACPSSTTKIQRSLEPPPLSLCPTTDNVEKIRVYHSATAVFCAPSNPSGIGSLYRETIQCTPWWQTGDITAHRRDCVVLNTGSDVPGMRGLNVARVHLFFLFDVGDQTFSCALIHEFCKTFDNPDPDNGIVEQAQSIFYTRHSTLILPSNRRGGGC